MKKILNFLKGFLIIYMLAAFVVANVNCFCWTTKTRFAVLLLSIIYYAAHGLISFLIEIDNEVNKPFNHRKN